MMNRPKSHPPLAPPPLPTLPAQYRRSPWYLDTTEAISAIVIFAGLAVMLTLAFCLTDK